MVKLQGKSTTNAPINSMATLHNTSCQSATDYHKYNYQQIHHSTSSIHADIKPWELSMMQSC